MTKKTETTLKVGYIVATLVIAVGGWIYAKATKDAQAMRNTNDIKQIQEDRRKDHDLIIEMKTDIAWIRNAMESAP